MYEEKSFLKSAELFRSSCSHNISYKIIMEIDGMWGEVSAVIVCGVLQCVFTFNETKMVYIFLWAVNCTER